MKKDDLVVFLDGEKLRALVARNDRAGALDMFRKAFEPCIDKAPLWDREALRRRTLDEAAAASVMIGFNLSTIPRHPKPMLAYIHALALEYGGERFPQVRELDINSKESRKRFMAWADNFKNTHLYDPSMAPVAAEALALLFLDLCEAFDPASDDRGDLHRRFLQTYIDGVQFAVQMATQDPAVHAERAAKAYAAIDLNEVALLCHESHLLPGYGSMRKPSPLN